MATRFNIGVGRQRITNRTLPHEAGYIASIQGSMRQIKENLARLIAGVENATPGALVFGLKPAFDKSQILVPVKTGKLRRSGFLVARRTSRGSSVSLGYARGGNPHYATLIHEQLEWRHQDPTQAKFLEAAINQHIGEFQPRVANYLRVRLGR